MRKSFLTGTVAALGLASVLSCGAFADGSLVDIANMGCEVAESVASCTLSGDVTFDSPIVIGNSTNDYSEVNINLNGHNITATSGVGQLFSIWAGRLDISGSGTLSADASQNVGVIEIYGDTPSAPADFSNVTIGEDVTVTGSNPILFSPYTSGAYGASADIYGTLNGTNSGIWLLGTISALDGNTPVINIHDGATVTASDGTALGIAGYGIWNIGDAYIEGTESGMGIKSGVVNINGAMIVATGPDSRPTSGYGNGFKPSGAAIQIESNSGYPGHMNISIEDAVIFSEHGAGIYHYLNTAETPLSIESLSVANTIFSTAGEHYYLSDELNNAEGVVTTAGSVIITEDAVVEGVDQLTEENVEVVAIVAILSGGNKELIEALEVADLTLIPQELNINVTADGAAASELSAPLTFTFNMPSLPAVADGYTRTYHLYRIHTEPGATAPTATEIAFEISEDGLYGSFSSDKFSSFVLGYTDTVANPNTYDGITTYVALALVAIFGLASGTVLAKREVR